MVDLKPNVLVVEDDKDFAENLKDILEDDGYGVSLCGTIECARKFLSSTHADVILLDLNLPDGDGASFLSEIRRLLPQSEVVVITGHASLHSATAAINTHAFGYLVKPVDIDQLRMMIRRAVQGLRSAVALREKTAELDQFFSVTPDLLCMADTNGYYRRVNPEWKRTLGYPIAEIENHKIIDFVHLDDQQSTQAVLAKLSQQKSVTGFVNRLRCADGGYRYVEWRAYPSGNFIYSAGHDITGHRKAEEALRESERQNREILESITDAFFSMTDDMVINYFNVAAERVFRRRSADVIGRRLLDAFPEFRDSVFENKYSESIQNKEPLAFECEFTVAPYENWYDVRVYPRPYGITVYLQVTTERKQAEAAISEREARLASIFRAAPVGIGLSNRKEIVDANDFLCDMTGYSREDLLGKRVSMLYENEQEHRRVSRDSMAQVAKNGIGTVETKWQRADGAIIDVLLSSVYVRRENGNDGVTFAAVDMTHHNAITRALRESESKYRQMVETSLEGIWLVDADGVTGYVNDEMARMLGRSADEMIGKPVADFMDSESQLDQEMRMNERRNGLAGRYERVYKHADGSDVLCMVSAAPVTGENGEFKGAFAMVTNITERKIAEQAISQSEEKFRTLTTLSPTGVYMTDTDGHCVYANERWLEMAGLSADEAMGDGWIQGIHPDDRHKVAASWYGMVESGGKWGLEYRFLNPTDGKITWIYGVARAVLNAEGDVTGYMGVNVDINERKHAEELGAMEESRMAALLSLNQMTESSLQNITLFSMEEAVRLTQSDIGYLAFLNEDETVLTMHAWSEKAMAECAIENKPLEYPVESTGLWGETVRQRKPIITNDYAADNPAKKGAPEGHVRLTRHMNVPIFDGDRIVVVIGVGNKPTDYDESDVRQLDLLISGMWRIVRRRQTEEALRASEERFRKSFDEGIVGMVMTNTDFRFVKANRTFCDMLGYTEAELQKLTFLDITHAEHVKQELAHVKRLMAGESQPYHTEKRYMKKGGGIIWASVSVSPVRNDDGELQHFMILAEDITERKRVEQALVQSESRYRTLFNEMNEGFVLSEVVYDNAGRAVNFVILDVNPAFERLAGLRRERTVGKTMTEVMPGTESKWLDFWTERATTGEPGLMEDYAAFLGKYIQVVCFCPREGQLASFFSDVTERKSVEAALRESNERLMTLSRQLVQIQESERRFLGRELHDQVGGTLTALSLALSLKRKNNGDEIADPLAQAKSLLSDLTSQIRRMSLDLRPPMLDDLGLIPAILWYVERYTAQTGVQVDFMHTGAERRFPQEMETAAYRIAQEALTNVARYASVVSVAVRIFADAEALHVQVEDEGEGFNLEEVINSRNTGGVTGMMERASLLGGTLVVDASPGHGTSLTATFPLV